mmetsp:Transcript_15/g.39  ORF Transcript_15/g.39 Transcript_15/m.39 type:complete len:257 (+) Transcript_15:218-988(+)
MSWHEGLQIVHAEGRGRHVVATRDIEAGKLLLTEECAASMTFRGEDENDPPPCCSTCMEPFGAETLKCKCCELQHYCSRACLDAGCRAYHSSMGECAAFEAGLETEKDGRKANRREFDFHDVPQRFLIRVLSQAGRWRVPGEPMTCDVINRILALEAHIPEEGSEEHNWLSAIARNTLRLMDESVEIGVAINVTDAAATSKAGEQPLLYGVRQLTRLLCCINCNSHTLYAREVGPLKAAGTAIYVQGERVETLCAC